MDEQVKDRALELLERCDLITLTSITEDGYPYSSVMTKLENDGLEHFYFFAAANSRKAANFKANAKACVSYHAPGGSVTLVGDVAPVTDLGIRTRCWRDFLKQAFPDGPQDEGLLILGFTARQGTICLAGRVEHVDFAH